MANLEELLDMEALVRLRQDLHMHPELGFQEERTSQIVADQLELSGWSVHRGIGKTGVVATLSNGEGPMVGFRADMDALAMEEGTDLPWRSTRPGCFHGCGHDGHTVVLLALARLLAATREFKGTVVLIFQPAEEGLGGGRVMVEEGLFDQFACERIYGFHNMPLLPLGKAAIWEGPFMASFDEFKITFHGEGSHAAMPHLSRDPVLAVAEAAVSVQGVLSREVDPNAAAALSVAQLHAGTTNNVIPAEGWLSGTIRTLDPLVREKLEAAIRRVAAGIAMARGVEVLVQYDRQYPVLVNDGAATAAMREAAERVLSPEGIDDNFSPLLASEDFAFMLQAKPGAYILLGQKDEAHPAMVHNPKYDFNDRLIPIATAVLADLSKQGI